MPLINSLPVKKLSKKKKNDEAVDATQSVARIAKNC